MHAAELQELPMMPEPTQVASLGQDGHGVDRADAGNGRQQLIVGQIRQQLDGPRLNHIALSDQAATFGQYQAEHADGIGIGTHWQSD